MFGFIRYGGNGAEGREEEVPAEGEDDMGRVVDVEEKAEDEEGVGRGPFPAAGCLSKSAPAEGNMDCRSAIVCPGG